MAPSFAQGDFSQALLKEFSHNRGEPVYKRFMCMNSGSEGVELSLRISDAHAKQHSGGKPSCIISMGDGFHGRTYRAATVSSSCRAKYLETLQSFGKCQRAVRFVEWNAVDDLEAVFSKAVADGFHIECMICEPVQGEGLAGLAMSPEFYARARELTLAHNTLLVVDSVQAAGRAYGTLSMLNAEAFAKLPGADIEVFSKALNAGQYPLSLLALGERAEGVYAIGTYGNTMTANPRALQVGTAMLNMMTDDVRKNIVASGAELIAGLVREVPGRLHPCHWHGSDVLPPHRQALPSGLRRGRLGDRAPPGRHPLHPWWGQWNPSDPTLQPHVRRDPTHRRYDRGVGRQACGVERWHEAEA